MATIKQTQALSSAIKTIASSVAKFAPYKTGNLSNSIKAWNTISNIVRYRKLETIIAFNFAPEGARYGKYWNNPYGKGSGTTATIKKRYPGKFNYANKGFHSYESRTALGRYMIEYGKTFMIDVIRNELVNKKY